VVSGGCVDFDDVSVPAIMKAFKGEAFGGGNCMKWCVKC
jgi:hypothetical protein